MAKYYENSTVFNYNYEQVLQGFWKRYPNPYSSHVLSEDTYEREIRKDGQLYSKRVLTKTNRVPKWGERFFRANFVCIIEESLVDPAAKTLTTYTRNIGFNKIMVSRRLFVARSRYSTSVFTFRASQRKSSTDRKLRVGRWLIGQHGSTLKCLALQLRSELLAVKDSRRTVRRR